ncbi:MAG: tRNA1(Val) (adenine(37)-N6)-methyltransferase [Bacillota bacterium]
MEQIHFLIPDKLKIIQNDKYFKFGTDSVLLANYINVRDNDKIIDLGSGSGVIPLLLAFKNNPKKIFGVELQKPLVEMSKRSVRLNKLEEVIEIINCDISNVMDHFIDNEFDIVVSNPPYIPADTGKVTKNKYKAIARHELKTNVEEIIEASVRLLRAKGKLYLVHLTKRLPEIIYILKENNIEPKEMRLIQSRENNNPDRFIMKAVMDGNPGFVTKTNIVEFVKNTNQYTKEIKKIYGEDQNE